VHLPYSELDQYDEEMLEEEQLWHDEYERGYQAGRHDKVKETNPTSTYQLGYDFGQEDRTIYHEEMYQYWEEGGSIN
jgi:hypothetical protein